MNLVEATNQAKRQMQRSSMEVAAGNPIPKDALKAALKIVSQALKKAGVTATPSPVDKPSAYAPGKGRLSFKVKANKIPLRKAEAIMRTFLKTKNVKLGELTEKDISFCITYKLSDAAAKKVAKEKQAARDKEKAEKKAAAAKEAERQAFIKKPTAPNMSNPSSVTIPIDVITRRAWKAKRPTQAARDKALKDTDKVMMAALKAGGIKATKQGNQAFHNDGDITIEQNYKLAGAKTADVEKFMKSLEDNDFSSFISYNSRKKILTLETTYPPLKHEQDEQDDW